MAFVDEARVRLNQYATVAWIDHSPLFVTEMEDALRAVAAMEKQHALSQLSSSSLTTPSTAALQARALSVPGPKGSVLHHDLRLSTRQVSTSAPESAPQSPSQSQSGLGSATVAVRSR